MWLFNGGEGVATGTQSGKGPAEATWGVASGVGVFRGGDPSRGTLVQGKGPLLPEDLGRPGPAPSLGHVTDCGLRGRARPPGGGAGPRWTVGAACGTGLLHQWGN